jgi:hypothetical protein
MTRVRAIFTLPFWLDAAERAVKTAAQAALLAVGADKVLDAMTADWGNVGAFALGGAVLSLLTSVASAPVPGVSPASMLPPGA